MKKTNFWLGLCAMLVFGGSMTSCSDDDEPEWNDNGSKVELPDHRMFILNEGSFKKNNANISLYCPTDESVISDLFQKQNGMQLGDTGQDMIEYDDYIYVAVYGSNYIAKLNAAGVEEKRISFTSDQDLQGGVRYMDAEDGYLYASFHGGAVAKINASSLTVEKKITGLGANLEGVAIEDDKLYVANSYSQSVNPETGKNVYTYHEEMYVIDLRTFSKAETLKVATNPNDVVEEDDLIFLISWGNYNDKGYDFQMIDPKRNNSVTSFGPATEMGVGNDRIYLVNSVTDWTTYVTTNTFFYYDINAGKLVNSSFMKNAPEELASASIYMIAVDDENGDIYVGTTNYSSSNGEIYRFKRDGSYVSKFDCGGQNPSKAVFLNR